MAELNDRAHGSRGSHRRAGVPPRRPADAPTVDRSRCCSATSWCARPWPRSTRATPVTTRRRARAAGRARRPARARSRPRRADETAARCRPANSASCSPPCARRGVTVSGAEILGVVVVVVIVVIAARARRGRDRPSPASARHGPRPWSRRRPGAANLLRLLSTNATRCSTRCCSSCLACQLGAATIVGAMVADRVRHPLGAGRRGGRRSSCSSTWSPRPIPKTLGAAPTPTAARPPSRPLVAGGVVDRPLRWIAQAAAVSTASAPATAPASPARRSSTRSCWRSPRRPRRSRRDRRGRARAHRARSSSSATRSSARSWCRARTWWRVDADFVVEAAIEIVILQRLQPASRCSATGIDDIVGVVHSKDLLRAGRTVAAVTLVTSHHARARGSCPRPRRSPSCCARCRPDASTWRSSSTSTAARPGWSPSRTSSRRSSARSSTSSTSSNR